MRDATLQWSTPQPTIVGVAAGTGVVTALRDGTAQVVCAAGGLTDSRNVRVFALVATVGVTPPAASIAVGAQQQFTATLRDARANIITGRAVTWLSSSAAANVTTAGLATGLAPGTSRIDASSGGVTGSATLTVLSPPIVATTDLSGVTQTAATFHGTVDPQGVATTAWFEYGTSPGLATFASTPPQGVGAGRAAGAIAASVANLTPGTDYYFRAAASSAGGTARGQILKFTTRPAAAPVARMISSAWNGNSFEILMSGGITTNGLATDAWFEWSDDAFFRQFTASVRAPIAAGDTEVAINGRYTMSSCAVWYVRVAAQNALGIHRSAAVNMGQAPPCIIR